MVAPITAVILAGGRATRMGGVDKGLMLFHGKSLIMHAIERLTPQVTEIVINANRELQEYRSLGLNLLQDQHPGFIGPLAGFAVGLNFTKRDYLLTVPCDSPLLPLNLAERLFDALQTTDAEIAVASTNGNTHPVFCLCKSSVLPSLERFIASGERKVSAWQTSLRYTEVDFSDYANAFTNINTPEDLALLAQTFN